MWPAECRCEAGGRSRTGQEAILSRGLGCDFGSLWAASASLLQTVWAQTRSLASLSLKFPFTKWWQSQQHLTGLQWKPNEIKFVPGLAQLSGIYSVSSVVSQRPWFPVSDLLQTDSLGRVRSESLTQRQLQILVPRYRGKKKDVWLWTVTIH